MVRCFTTQKDNLDEKLQTPRSISLPKKIVIPFRDFRKIFRDFSAAMW